MLCKPPRVLPTPGPSALTGVLHNPERRHGTPTDRLLRPRPMQAPLTSRAHTKALRLQSWSNRPSGSKMPARNELKWCSRIRLAPPLCTLSILFEKVTAGHQPPTHMCRAGLLAAPVARDAQGAVVRLAALRFRSSSSSTS